MEMKTGEVYLIRNKNGGGKNIVEGKAKLVESLTAGFGPINSDENDYDFERWVVEFIDEPGETYARNVKYTDKVDA